jgi:hypothetical protein
MDLIARGTKARTIATTNMNESSSRSHSILTVHIESKDNSVSTAAVHMGKLNLVDLAGSERLSRSGILLHLHQTFIPFVDVFHILNVDL